MGYDSITDMKIGFVDMEENPSGIGEEAYFIPRSYFADIKSAAAATTTASIVTITGNHVLKPEKAPIPVNILYEKSGGSSALEGEILSKIFKTGIEMFVPNLTKDNVGTAVVLKNTRGILLVRRPEQETGWIQIGSKSIAAYAEAMEANLGTGPTGEVGVKMTVTAYGKTPYWFYEGELPAPAP